MTKSGSICGLFALLSVTAPAANETVELTRCDLDELLQKSGVDYLFVASDPPTRVRRGEAYAHRLAVKSKRGGVTCKLDAGPAGMTVTDEGGIEQRIPADFADKTASVIIAVKDASGQETFRSFTLTVDP